MALLVCNRCTTRFAVGLPYCPQCTSTDCYTEGEEDDMAKITVHGGPSNAGEVASPPAAASPATALEAASPEPEAAAEAKGYAASTVEELRDLLRQRELPVSGAKAELVERLEADDQAQAEADEAP